VSTTRSPSDPARPPEAAPPPPVIASESLFAPGQNEVVIEHGGVRYRLRQTRNGKLILTK